jgi:hypothetical protein
MHRDRQQNLQDLLVFGLLVAIGVAGRWGQPEWCFTPIAATAMFAGLYFSRIAIAALVPVATLAISDLILSPYDSIGVMIATYAVMIVPVWFGRLQRGERSRLAQGVRWALFGLLPALLFYIVTNFAVWAFKSNYDKTLAGLGKCYVAAVPFFRWMLAGDVFYLVVLLGCLALAIAGSAQRVIANDAAAK